MSAEAAGFALADTLYRRQAVVLGDEQLHMAGERLVKHLKRRGYKIVFDPKVYEELPEAKPVVVPRLEPPAVPVVKAVLLSIGEEDLRCLECGCWTFYVEGKTATCSGCRQKHTIRR